MLHSLKLGYQFNSDAMAAILPQGLIHPPPDDQLVLDTASHADNQDILRRFWRGGYICSGATSSALTHSIVYSIQSHASHDDSSSRASNLFWRVWSSPTLSRSMPSTTLTRLLHHCGQAFELTPIADSLQLPRLGSYEVPPSLFVFHRPQINLSRTFHQAHGHTMPNLLNR